MIIFNKISEENVYNCITDCDTFVLSIGTEKTNYYIKISEDFFDFSNLDRNHKLFSIKTKKVVGNFKIESPKSNWIDISNYLRSNAYSFKCSDKDTKNLKSIPISLSKNINFEE